MLVIFLRALILYILVIFSVRLMGKRQIGELQPSELAITILVSNIATLPLEDTTLPIITGVIPMLSLVCFDVIMSAVTLRFKRVRRIVSGAPRVIISNGVLDQKSLRQLRFSLDDLFEMLRQQGIFDISEVQFAVVETTGQISVLQKKDYRPITIELSQNKNAADQNPPRVIINDGVLINEALCEMKLSRRWLGNVLKQNGVKVKDVFMLSADSDKKYTIIRKDGKK